MTTLVAEAQVRRALDARRPRSLTVAGVLALALAAAVAVSVSLGEVRVPLLDVPAAVLDRGDPDSAYYVQTFRLPRVALTVVVAVAFAVSGALFQTLADNPLASPDIIGVNVGASLGVVVAVVVLGASGAVVATGSVLGGLGTALLVYVLGVRGGVSTQRLVLVGLGLAGVLGALINLLLVRAPELDARRAESALIGSVNGATWAEVATVAAGLAVLLPAAVVLQHRLTLLQLGPEVAAGAGVAVDRSSTLILLVGVLLACLGTAAAGPVAFVAFIAPPVARRLVRGPGPALLVTALFGAVLLVVADVLGRAAFGEVELPVGLVMGMLGAPYLLWLLARSDREGERG